MRVFRFMIDIPEGVLASEDSEEIFDHVKDRISEQMPDDYDRLTVEDIEVTGIWIDLSH